MTQAGEPMRIRLAWSGGSIAGVLDDTENARLLFNALPFGGKARTWGEEVYFDAPVQMKLEPEPKTVVPRGTICFWVQGGAVAIPYGPTPIAEKGECRLVTAVNVLGRLEGNAKALAGIRDGDEVRLEREEGQGGFRTVGGGAKRRGMVAPY